MLTVSVGRMITCMGHLRFDGACRAIHTSVRSKPREEKNARAVARDYFERFPKNRYETSVKSWRHLQCDNYEFTMKRLREPKANPEYPSRRNVSGAHSPRNAS
jgi:hypothetical protein